MTKHTNKTTPTEAPGTESERAHVREVLGEFSTVMLLTGGMGKDLRTALARPMSVAHREDDGSLWFITGHESERTEDARHSGLGHVTAQSSTRFVSLSGRVEESREAADIDKAWSKMAEAWFPEGKTDPRVAVLKFHPAIAELWDVSGAKGLRFLLETGKALITGEPPKPSEGQHERVRM
jgi:general stress protein 26